MAVLGIDTCGPSGSVALGRIGGNEVEILAETALEGRTYSATLVAAIGDLLKKLGLNLGDIGCLVVVQGPGSFTGVRVGLSAAKGLAEGAVLPVAAVSRLEVLGFTAGIPGSALDAHRHEVFLRLRDQQGGREFLAGAAELESIEPRPKQIAVCDEAAAALLEQAWPGVALVRMPSPTAADAMRLAAPQILRGEFADVGLLDGHYLRRSDAEIFGESASASASA